MRKILLLAMSLLFYAPLIAQNRSLSGTVIDKSDNGPLDGVTVIIKGTQTATITNGQGKFIMNVPTSGGTLIFSYVGYETQQIDFLHQSTIDVSLSNTEQLLKEVVVVGYGTQIKTEVTGSIAEVKGEDIARAPVTSIEQALQGKAAGVFVETNNGKVGSAIKVRVRGSSSITANNEPLYVVDGIPINTKAVNDEVNLSINPLNDIDFNNIESVSILKDAAAAAIYGSRGANGVVLITTKRGKEGKSKVTIDYQQGWSKPTRLREFMNTDQYVNYFEQAAVNGGKYDFANGLSNYDTEQEAIDDYLEDVHKQFDRNSGWADWTTREVSTDWQSLAFQKATSRDVNASVSGGTDKLQYFIAGGYSQQDGILINNYMNRGSIQINLDSKLSDKFDLGTSLQMSRSLNNDVPNDDYFESPMQIVAQSPLTPPRDTLGELNEEPVTLYFNPLLEAQYTQSNNYTFRTVGNIYANFHILPSLTLRGEAGGDFTNFTSDRYSGSRSNFGQSVGGYGEAYASRVENYDTKLLLTYLKNFNNIHNLEATGGMEYQPYSQFYQKVDGQGFPNDDLKTLASASQIVYGTSYFTQYRFISYFARANYNFKEKYLFSLTGRIDGSSRFGENKRYGFFPSASAGWILSQEQFLTGIPVISFLKVRASAGEIGNAEIGDFDYIGKYGVASYNGNPALYPSTIENPDLTWERTFQFDLGIDFGFFGDRLNGELDYYIKNTSNLLLDVPVPATTGILLQTQNIGKMKNNGVEIVVNGDILVREFKWTASINFAANKNEVVELAPGQDIIDNGGSDVLNVVKVGEPLGVFYGAEYAGVDPANGDALWYVNGTEGSTETTNDFNLANFVVLGDPNPDFIAGFSNSFSYKGFSLDVATQSVYGNQINLNGDHWMESNGAVYDNQTTHMLDSWQNPGDITDVPQARLGFDNGDQTRSSRYIDDGSYIRLKSLTLGYDFSSRLIKKAKLTNLRIYLSAYNLLTITNYRGWDPEVTSDYVLPEEANVIAGIDFYSAPQPKTFVFGVTIGL
ncbi:MAG: TonB-dependent receptor [Chitinophagaceae bacterium]|nr:TonB-dependent receptor [Chitinophagaceae bacterium]